MSAPSEGDRVLVQVEATYRGTYDIGGREFVYVYDDEGGTYSLPQVVAVSVVTPPKPAEPTGLGAVVECEYDGRKGTATNTGAGWTFYGGHLVDHSADWYAFDAVRVLSEGVQL